MPFTAARATSRRSPLIVVLAGATAFSAGAPAAQASVDIEVSGGGRRMVLRYELAEPQTWIVEIGGEPYTELSLPGEPVTMQAGAPSLPRVCRSVIVPGDARMAVRVLDAQYREVPAEIVPSKGSLPRTVDPAEVPYRFGPAYDDDAFYPGELAALRDPYILRDHRGVVVELYPFQWNPVTGVLRIYTDVTLEVFAVGPGQVNTLRRVGPQRAASAAFEQIYRHQFINYEPPVRYDPLNESGELLIICHDPWLPHMQAYVEHKRSAGITTTIVPVSAVGPDAADIKAYVQQVYDTSNLSFLLLVGDAEHVTPGWFPHGEGLAASDPEYSLLAGDDSYPDIIVGRFSARGPADVLTQADRTVTYERLPATEQDWFWRGIGAGSEQGPGDDGEMDFEHILIIRQWLLDYGYTHVDGFEDPLDVDMGLVRAAFNEGRGIFNFCGHGGSGGMGGGGFGWGMSDVDSMTNVNKLTFMTCVACSTGDFVGKDCIGEWFLWATHNGEPAGAIGTYCSSVGQYWNEPMEAQDEFNLMYVAEQYASYGALCYAGSCSMMDDYGQSGVDMFMTWHVFGDPALRVVGTVPPPAGLDVRPFSSLVSGGPGGGPFDPSALTYTLTNWDDTAIDFAVSADAAWVDLSDAGGTLAAGGETDVTVSLNALAGLLEDGEYAAAVDFVNLTDGGATTTRSVILKVGEPVPVHVFNLNEQLDWTMEGEWAYGQPTGQGGDQYGNPDPTGGATGLNVYGVNLHGDYSPDPGGPFYLTTSAIDCFELKETSLHFQRWLNTDFRPYVMATVEVSDNGTDWTVVWENPGSEMVDSAWAEFAYDISQVADLSPAVFIRWGYEKDPPSYPYSGWNLDDIAIWGNDVEPIGMHVLPDEDFDTSGPLGGPFTPASVTYSLSNHCGVPIEFTVEAGAPWISVSQTSGVVPLRSKTNITVSVNGLADDLPNGFYEAPVTITNTTTHEGDTVRMVSLDINEPGLIYAVNLDLHPGWTLSGEWAFGQPTGQGGVDHGNPDPTGGATGSTVYGVNLHGDYSIDPGGPYYLRTTAFDCTSLDDVQVRFKRWLNTDHEPYVYATIDVSNDRVQWTPVWSNGDGTIAEDAWSDQVYDISSVADRQRRVYVRWGYQVEPAAYPYSGWNIDDVEIWAASNCPGDVVADGVVNVLDFLAVLAAWGECPGCAADVNGDGVVNVVDFLAVLAAWGECT
ncbi:MAG: C25 family cysteine peptidase [Planctomycetota bacterium]|jgi:hypothetical protein